MPYGRKQPTYKPKVYTRGGRRNYRRNFTRTPAKAVPHRYEKSIKAAVSKAISSRTENKFAAYNYRVTNIPAVIGTVQAVNIGSVVPPITQGPGMFANRIGNSIRPKYLDIQGWVTLDMSSEDKNYDKVGIRIFVGYVKKYPLWEDSSAEVAGSPQDNWSYHLLDYGTGTSAFAGTLQSYQAPVNHRVFTCKAERRFVLTRPRIFDAAFSSDDMARYSGNSLKFFKIRVKCPPQMEYKNNQTQTATNFSPVLLCGYSLLNGFVPPTPDASAPKPVQLSYTTRLSYEDA